MLAAFFLYLIAVYLPVHVLLAIQEHVRMPVAQELGHLFPIRVEQTAQALQLEIVFYLAA
jgi:hypothetical protein